MGEVRHATDPVSGQKVEIRNDLVRRLRGQYACGPTKPDGEPEFGWRQFGEPVPIQVEAADEIDRLREVAKTSLTVLCAVKSIGGLNRNMDKDLQIAIDGCRAVLGIQ